MRTKYIRVNMFASDRNGVRHCLYHLNQGCFLSKAAYSLNYYIFDDCFSNIGQIQYWLFLFLKDNDLIVYNKEEDRWYLTDKPYQIEYVLKQY